MSDPLIPALAPSFTARFHAARCSDGIAILDIGGDAYLSIYAPHPPGSTPAERHYADRALVERLLGEAHLLAPSAGFREICCSKGMPCWRELPAMSPSRPPLGVALAFLMALARTCMLVRTRSFARLIATADCHRKTTRAFSQPDLARLVGWFDRLSLWLPVRPLCLFRSLMLLLFLRRRGLDTQWVFGVTLFPFQAHCWLAIDDLLVGERGDRVAEFVVIFATGLSPA